MAEIYTIQLKNGQLEFVTGASAAPASALAPKFNPKGLNKNLEIVCRMGDPDLIHCIVFRELGKPGGVFSMYDKDGLLFCAVAENNLTFTLAQGHFGGLVANARYGVDVFENMEIPDD